MLQVRSCALGASATPPGPDVVSRFKAHHLGSRTVGELQEIFLELGGQDDNLGDSVLRAAYLDAVRGDGRRFHVFVGREATADYLSGLPLRPDDLVYTDREAWTETSLATARPVHLLNAGEINPRIGASYPDPGVGEAAERAVAVGGKLIVAGIGMRFPDTAGEVLFSHALRNASVLSWRDRRSHEATGLGGVAPDWAYALGTPTADWAPAAARPLLAVTLRFDRAWPGDGWLRAVRDLADRTGTRIVTVAQVARDAPRAVRLAELLDGEYLQPSSMSHADLDAYARGVYAQSLAVISDRAHGLIIAATEGAYPIGSAADPEKIIRMMEMADLHHLVGSYDQLPSYAEELERRLPALAPGIDRARAEVAALTERIQGALRAEVSHP